MLLDAPKQAYVGHMTDTAGMLPCPFCGSEFAEIVESQDTSGGEDSIAEDVFMASCNCGVSLEWEHSRERAIAAWNRRTALAGQADAGGQEAVAAERSDAAGIGSDGLPFSPYIISEWAGPDMKDRKVWTAYNAEQMRAYRASASAPMPVDALRELVGRIRSGSEVAPWVYDELAALVAATKEAGNG